MFISTQSLLQQLDQSQIEITLLIKKEKKTFSLLKDYLTLAIKKMQKIYSFLSLSLWAEDMS